MTRRNHLPKQIYWEDIQPGTNVDPLPKIATTQTLVKWAGATGDFHPLHYEDTFAAAQGVNRPVIHGRLKRAWLIQLVTAWMGDLGTLTKLNCRFLKMDYPRLMKSQTEPQEGETWLCKGKVISKSVDGHDHLIELEVWLENGVGETTASGTATVSLPSKSS